MLSEDIVMTSADNDILRSGCKSQSEDSNLCLPKGEIHHAELLLLLLLV